MTAEKIIWLEFAIACSILLVLAIIGLVYGIRGKNDKTCHFTINKIGEEVNIETGKTIVCMENWSEFYEWLKDHNYYVVEDSYIFRNKKLITSFDPQEDDDSGEIEATIYRIKENDKWVWKK